jgi:hypothetical protein
MANLDPDPHVVLRIGNTRSGAFLAPGSGMGKKSGSGSEIRIRDEQTGSYFREIRNNFLVKMLKFFDADPGWKKFGSGMEKNSDPG